MHHEKFFFQFADRGVAMSAIDMMSLLSEVGVEMFRLYPSMPLRVLQAICYAIAGKTVWYSVYVVISSVV